ncbi:MAG: hypothetical protein H7101_11300 [Deinococcales bacterium]|nr:hypothetical protein [Chitinophagaceae bacterium]
MSLEVALNNVFKEIDTNYIIPTAEMISSSFEMASIKNPYFGATKTSVKFDFGTQKEVNAYLKMTKEKYPLVWLVYPFEESFTNTNIEVINCKNVRLVFSINTDINRTSKFRHDTSKIVLENLVDYFLKLMKQSKFTKYISIDKTVELKKTFYPNYAVNKEQTANAQSDVWDAISIDCNFILRNNCTTNN